MNSKTTNIYFVVAFLLLVALSWRFNISSLLFALLVLVFLIVNFWGAFTISSQFFIHAKCRSLKNSGRVALTFDDGPVPEKTARILSILRQFQVKATFFCIGRNAEKYPELIRQIKNEGHLIGNHSYTHSILFDLQSSEAIKKELAHAHLAIQNINDLSPRWFRPPYGVTNPMVAKAVRKSGYLVIGWSVRSLDTATNNHKKLFDRVTQNLRAGDIILFHDRCDITAEVLPDVLAYIKTAGLHVGPLDELLDEKAYAD